jgi:hypothetical protein
MKHLSVILICMGCVFTAFGADDAGSAGIDRKPLKIATGIEQGMIVHGRDEEYVTEYGEQQWLSRLGVWLNQEVVIRDRLIFRMGVGGMFWYSFPEMEGQSHTLNTKFGPGVAQATGIYKLGNIDSPLFEFQFGYFPFKYNNEAQNLGEYLLRSGAYPGYIDGGSWNIIGDALYRCMGVRLSNYLLDKTIKQHVIVSMERDYPPMYDFALTYIGDASIGKAFDIGAGVCLTHIPVKPKKTTPENVKNRYLGDRALSQKEGVSNMGLGVDTLPEKEYYTFTGVKLMGKVCIDPKVFFSADIFGAEDLKIFAEAAILGVKDYPFYYDDISKRIPIMFGFNIPTFKILDVFSVQIEYYGCEFENSLENLFMYQIPVWYVENYDPLSHDDSTTYANNSMPDDYGTYREYYQNDNWKWSINLSRSFGKHFTVFAQFANDNMRHKYYNARPQYIPVTRGNSGPFQFFTDDWYFVFRLNFGA